MRVISISFILAGTLVLTGCKDSSDRPLSYDKGVYAGKAEPKLTANQVEALRHRGALQR